MSVGVGTGDSEDVGANDGTDDTEDGTDDDDVVVKTCGEPEAEPLSLPRCEPTGQKSAIALSLSDAMVIRAHVKPPSPS